MPLPPGYTSRPPRDEDAEPIVEMLNEGSLALAGVALARPDWITRPWSAPGADRQRDFAVVETAGGALAGYLMCEWEPPDVVFFIGVVGLAHHGRGIGAAIVEAAERRGREMAARAPAGEPVTLRAGALADEHHVSALLTARGFVEVRHFLEMRIVFPGPPAPPQPVAGIEIRPFASGEEAAVHECMNDAFRDHWGSHDESLEEWVHEHVGGQGYAPELWRIAWRGERAAGALIAHAQADEDATLGSVGMLGVRRDERRRGIAEALLRSSFVAFAERGSAGALLHVDATSQTGAVRLYERLGMTSTPRFATWDKPLTAAD